MEIVTIFNHKMYKSPLILVKKTILLDLYQPLKDFTVKSFSEEPALKCDLDLKWLNELRLAVYYTFLFDLGKNYIHTIAFTWLDAFTPKKNANNLVINNDQIQ